MFDIQARLQISANRGEGSDLSYDLKANPSSMLQRQGEALKVVICFTLEASQSHQRGKKGKTHLFSHKVDTKQGEYTNNRQI